MRVTGGHGIELPQMLEILPFGGKDRKAAADMRPDDHLREATAICDFFRRVLPSGTMDRLLVKMLCHEADEYRDRGMFNEAGEITKLIEFFGERLEGQGEPRAS